MSQGVQGVTSQSCRFAIIFASLLATHQGLWAQNIYKCGSSYSQTPCEGASTLNLDDARTSAQKKQTDAASRGDAKQAKALEKDRLVQEKANMVRPSAAAAPTPAAVPEKPHDAHNVVSVITPKRLKSPAYKPDAFIALVPGSDKKPVKKKASKKKSAKSD